MKSEFVETDVLVIGGGMAGLFAAVKAREAGARVLIVDKNYVSRSGATVLADGSFCVQKKDWGDDFGYAMDFITHGSEYINDPEWTEAGITESSARFDDLQSWGVEPLKGPDGSYIKGGGFPEYMNFNCLQYVELGPATVYLPKLRKHVEKLGIEILDHIMVTTLLCEEGQSCGAAGFHCKEGTFYSFHSKAVVLATGSGTLSKHTRGVNMSFLSFDGDAMAYRAGASIRGMEFKTVCFAPPKNEEERVDISGKEVYGAPAKHQQWNGEIMFFGFLPYVDAEGYPVDRRTAAVSAHEGRAPIYMDRDAVEPWAFHAIGMDSVPQEAMASSPGVQGSGNFRIDRAGLDMSREGLWKGLMRLEYCAAFRVGGAAGVASKGVDCSTDIKGLYGAGDAYGSLPSGACYPNLGLALRNAAVTGARAGESAAAFAKGNDMPAFPQARLDDIREQAFAPLGRKGGFCPAWAEQQLENLLVPYYVCYIKDAARIQAALTFVEFLKNHVGERLAANDIHELRHVHEAKNRILAMEISLRAILFREESRGGHYREDFPARDDRDWLAWVDVQEQDGKAAIVKTPVPESAWPDPSKPYRERYPNRFYGETTE